MIKKFLPILLLLSVNYFSEAQTNIGIKAGYNYSTARVIADSMKQKTAYVSGYSFGIMFKAPFEGVLHFSPYIAYNRRGYKYFPSAGNIKEIENTIHYIDVAPGLSVDFPAGKHDFFIIGVSPVFGFAIAGREKNIFKNDSLSNNKMEFGFGEYGEYDISLTGNIGFRINDKFLIEASYQYGVANIDNRDIPARNIQNRMFNLSLGYYIK